MSFVVASHKISVHVVHFSPVKIFLLTQKKGMEQTLELSGSPRSAARQFMAMLIEFSIQKDEHGSNEKSTEKTPEKSAAPCQNAPDTKDLQETPADNSHK